VISERPVHTRGGISTLERCLARSFPLVYFRDLVFATMTSAALDSVVGATMEFI
jgi:hypothetical protein